MSANIILDSDDEDNQVGVVEANDEDHVQANKNGLNDIPDDIA